MNSKEVIIIIVNPALDRRKRKRILNLVEQTLLQQSVLFKIFNTEWPEEINRYKEIWLIGGDGTLNYLLNYYRDISIPIAIFKGGTGNDFAWRLYGNLTVSKQIDRILSGSPRLVDAAMCNGRIFINGAGIGFDGEVLRAINTVRRIGGHAGYLLIVLRKLFTFREKHFAITFQNKVIKGRYLLVMITNSSRTGGGFLVAPTARIDDGKLDLILCKPLSIFKRLSSLPIIEKGDHLEKDFIYHQHVTKLSVESTDIVYAQIDGELIEGKSFEITVMPNRYWFKY